MCGIAGIVRYDAPAAASVDALRAMARALAHRGPDGRGEYLDPRATGGAALAHTRLALLDARGGAQPMVSPDGRYALVFNGEVYNHRALRAELAREGWPFCTASDTEVVLAAYARWGRECTARLDGMYAFFVWDARERTGFAARDPLGVKPFCYHVDEHGALWFASEAKALLAALPWGARPRPRASALLEYLAAPFFSGVAAPMFEGLAYLEPGGALEVSPREGVRTWRHFDFTFDPLALREVEDARAVAALAGEVREALARAVAWCLDADVPVGAFFSGGLDSTALVALAARHAGTPPLCFTVRFEDQADYDYARSTIVTSDDLPVARAAARALGVTQREVRVARTGLARDLGAIARTNDALPAWEQEFAQHHLARAAARERKAVLVGDAADETHFGYHFLLDATATASPAAILRRFGPAPVHRALCEDPVAMLSEQYVRLATDAGHRWDTPAERTLATTYLIVKRWLPRLLHNGDAHTMAFGLEARVPFAARALLAHARRVPPALGLRGGVEKWLLREALSGGLIPEAVRTRRKSALPKDQRTALVYQSEAARALDEDGGLLRSALDVGAVRALCSAPPEALTEGERASLFRVAALGHWAQHYGVTAL